MALWLRCYATSQTVPGSIPGGVAGFFNDIFLPTPTKENGQWIIKTNLELITKYKSQDIVTVIKIRRLEWLGHVIRMNETRSVKKNSERKLEEEVKDDQD